MAGFLNKKNRLIDYKLTEHGRKQLNDNNLKFKYFTFSDRSIIYSKNLIDGKQVSDSEEFFLPFEATTDPGLYYNPEFYLSNELTYFNSSNSLGLQQAYSTLAANLSDSRYLSKKLINNSSLKVDNNFNFDFIDIKERYNFLNSVFSRKYPTIKYLKENIKNIKSVKKDERFRDSLRYKKLEALNSEGGVLKLASTENETYHPAKSIIKSLNIKNNITLSDSKNNAVIKAINSLEKNINTFKLSYTINTSFTSIEDVFHFEMHSIDDSDKINKIPFVKLGEFIDSNTKTSKEVFLIGKFFEDKNILEEYNIENNTTFINKIKDYYFINMFILVVEKWSKILGTLKLLRVLK